MTIFSSITDSPDWKFYCNAYHMFLSKNCVERDYSLITGTTKRRRKEGYGNHFFSFGNGEVSKHEL